MTRLRKLLRAAIRAVRSGFAVARKTWRSESLIALLPAPSRCARCDAEFGSHHEGCETARKLALDLMRQPGRWTVSKDLPSRATSRPSTLTRNRDEAIARHVAAGKVDCDPPDGPNDSPDPEFA
jgi:hypothetical protein